jgi:hypothetical protein
MAIDDKGFIRMGSGAHEKSFKLAAGHGFGRINARLEALKQSAGPRQFQDQHGVFFSTRFGDTEDRKPMCVKGNVQRWTSDPVRGCFKL